MLGVVSQAPYAVTWDTAMLPDQADVAVRAVVTTAAPAAVVVPQPAVVPQAVVVPGPGGFCPPGLAKKNNGCLPPGHAK